MKHIFICDTHNHVQIDLLFAKKSKMITSNRALSKLITTVQKAISYINIKKIFFN